MHPVHDPRQSALLTSERNVLLHAERSERFLFLVSIIPLFGDALFQKVVDSPNPEILYLYSLGRFKTASRSHRLSFIFFYFLSFLIPPTSSYPLPEDVCRAPSSLTMVGTILVLRTDHGHYLFPHIVIDKIGTAEKAS